MKKLFLTLVFVCCFISSVFCGDTGLGTSPFVNLGNFTYEDANAINDGINDNNTRITVNEGYWTTIRAIVGPIFGVGDGTYTDLSALSSTELLKLNGITGSLYESGGTDVAVADGGTGAGTASGARTNLGLVIGTDVLAPDGDGSNLTGIVTSSALDDVTNPDANKTFDTSTHTIAFDMDSGGAFRIGDVAGGNYMEYLYGYVRFVGDYYMQGSFSMADVDADGEYAGQIMEFTVDSGVTEYSFGQVMHIDTDGEIINADDDAEATLPAIGLLIDSGATGSGKKVLTSGCMCESDWNWTVGGYVYVSGAPGTAEGLTQTAPTADFGQVVGTAYSADCINVNIQQYVEF